MERDEVWITAQQSVIGSCLIDQRAVGSIVFNLCEDDFQDVNRTLYRIIRERYTTGKAVDPVAVLGDLAGSGDSKAYKDYIWQLVEITPTAANIKTYADICRERSRVHRYQEIGMQLATVSSSKDGAEIVRESNRLSIGRGMASWNLNESMRNFFERYNRKVDYLPWFLRQLDSQLSLELGDFCLLGGRPSSGKSAFALQAATYWAVACGMRVGFYSFETSREKLTNRLVAASCGVKLDDIKHSKLSDKDLTTVCNVSARIAEAPLDLISAAGKTVAEIQAFALERRHQIVIVDYLQIISDPGKDEYSQVSNISKQLHTMCQSLGIYCLALCQLNRTKGARPALEDLRSSGQLEQDADAVIFLHRQEGRDAQRELIIAKNKEGECRSTLLHFDGPVQRFSYLGKGEKPLQGVDYEEIRYRVPPQELEQLGMDTEVPFEEGK